MNIDTTQPFQTTGRSLLHFFSREFDCKGINMPQKCIKMKYIYTRFTKEKSGKSLKANQQQQCNSNVKIL